MYISSQEKISLSDEAAFLIAKLADGGMRDALSLLDQCMAFSEDITAETVSMAAGIAGRDHVFGIITSITEQAPSKAITAIDELYAASKDMSRLCEEIIFQLRNIMLIKITPDNSGLITCMPDELDILTGISEKLSLEAVLSFLSEMQECSERMLRAVNKRVELEMCIIKLASGITEKPAAVGVPSDLMNRLSELERKLQSGAASGMQNRRTEASAPVINEPQVDFTKLDKKNLRQLNNWAEVLQKFSETNPAVSASLTDSKAFVNGDGLFIIAKNPFFISLFRNKENAAMLGDAVESVLGKRFAIRAKCDVEATEEEKNAIKLIEKAKNSNLENYPEG
jgi:DNA polymerase-3 subunit gamma/tau